MNTNETINVSDWSQKYKLAVYAIAIVAFSAWIYLWVMPFCNELLSLLQHIDKSVSETNANVWSIQRKTP